ncbi:MAG TPA: PQQ-binding-like beta-propeller repeat protein [Ktedonobacterales bacterium]|jgi:serine/threonine-protein kinase
MQKRLAQLILLLSLVLLAACSPASQGGPALVTAPATTATQTSGPVNVYVGTIGDASDDGAVIALSGTTGQPLWNHNTGHVASSSPVLDHGVAYVGTDTSLIALSMQDGKQLWSYATPNTANVLGVENGLVFGMTNQDNPAIYALDASTGKARWTYATSDTVEQAFLADGVIYASISKPNCHCSHAPTTLLALNASDGSTKWQTSPYSDYFTIRQVANGLLYGSHATAEGPSNDLQVRRASDGSVVWQFPKDSNTDLSLIAIDGTSLYVLTNDLSNFPDPGNSTVYALNATTGATLWQTPINKTAFFTGTLINQVIYLGANDDSSLTALRATDGKLLWQTAMDTPNGPTDKIVSAAAVIDGTVYLSTATGFAALKESDGSIVWKAPVAGFAYILAVQNGIVYCASSATDTNPAGQNAIIALKASDGSSLWSYQVPAIFSTPVVG